MNIGHQYSTIRSYTNGVTVPFSTSNTFVDIIASFHLHVFNSNVKRYWNTATSESSRLNV